MRLRYLAAIAAIICTLTGLSCQRGPAVDPTLDTDGDGLTDVEERRLGTLVASPDTDRDGFSDGLEVRQGTDPLVPDAPALLPQGRPE